jgi:hypothetical protein
VTEIQNILLAYDSLVRGLDNNDPGSVKAWLISPESLQRSFTELNVWSWIVWAILTMVGGFYLLILDKAGFGLIADYILCFFWGIGLPTTAEKLTPAGVLQSLRITTIK